MKAILFFLFFINSCTLLFGQHVFHHTFGKLHDYSLRVRETYDGGYVVSGYTIVDNSGGMFLQKLDQKGQFQWFRTYGGSSSEVNGFVELTPDSGFLLVGTTYSFGITYRNIYIAKADKQGNMEWEWKESGVDGYDAVCTPDGGYLVVGSGEDSLDGNFNGWSFYLIKLDEYGNTVWTKTHSKSTYDVARFVVPTNDFGYIIAGTTADTTADPGTPRSTAYIIKVNSNGKLIWERGYYNFNKYSITPSYLYLNADQSITTSFGRLRFSHLDKDGFFLWNDTSIMGYISPTLDDGFIGVGGRKHPTGWTSYEVHLRLWKYDASRNLEWERVHNIGYRARPQDIQQTSDGGYIITGNVDISKEDNDLSDIFILKADCEGNIEFWSEHCWPAKPEPPPKFTFYPNPFRFTTTIHLPEAIESFGLFDITGRLLLYEKNISNENYALIAGDLPAGVYVYRISTVHNDYHGKLVVQ